MYLSDSIIVPTLSRSSLCMCFCFKEREGQTEREREGGSFLTITSVLQLNHQRHWIHLECSRWFHKHKAWRTFPQQRVLRRPYCCTPPLLSTLLAETQILHLKSKFHISHYTTFITIFDDIYEPIHEPEYFFFIIMLSLCQNVMSFTYKIMKLRYFC